MTVAEDFESGHSDRVTVLHINNDGSKILTASIDHRVKVWNVDRATGERQLIETFTAHDADIRDAKWLHPSTGTHLGTIGNDLKFHLWQEDPLQAPNSGRRFRRIHSGTIQSRHRVPFVSLDFKNVDHIYTYLALIDRQGLLSIYEPSNPDEIKDWSLIDQFYVSTPPPGRGDLTCFKVRFDQNITPLPYINCLSDDRRQLSLVVTALNEVKIYRSVASAGNEGTEPVDSGGLQSGAREASHRFMFYEAARLPMHPALVRDVQWAPFNVRGTDLFATACKDGAVRIFEMAVTEIIEHPRSPQSSKDMVTSQTQATKTPAGLIRQQSQHSVLTSAITSRNQSNAANASSNPQAASQANPNVTGNATRSIIGGSDPRATQHSGHRFSYAHNIENVANLASAHDDAWSVVWEPSGQVLMSSGADGMTKIWRRSILSSYRQAQTGEHDETGTGRGKWMLFADQAVDLGANGTEDSEEGSDLE